MDLDADILVIGGGMAGLVAGTVAAEGELETLIIRKGQSATAYSSGAIDLIGYLPELSEPFGAPTEGLAAIAGFRPLHPYSIIGYDETVRPEDVVDTIIERAKESVTWLKSHLNNTVGALVGDFKSNIHPITILGTTKPTCLIQKTMDSGRLQEQDDSTLLFVGITGYPDFNPSAAAKTYLEDRIALGLPPRRVANCTVTINPFGNVHNISAIEIARHLDHEEAIKELATSLKPSIERVGATHVAFPPILGFQHAIRNQVKLNQILDIHVFELLGFPPSIPGLRLQMALEEMFRKAGGKLLVGHEAISYEKQADRLVSVKARAPRREILIHAKTFLLATGKFIGTGLCGDEQGVRETTFGLMTVTGSYNPARNIHPSKMTNRLAISPDGHPLFSTGITVDPSYRPIQEDGSEWASNLFAAGSILAGYNYSVEKSGLGVALTSGYSAGKKAINYAKEVS
ncbi:MAG: anaerobic glycerol-3-phosphate dehydrogenase subunit GlpB [Promethearchaeota archaeon]